MRPTAELLAALNPEQRQAAEAVRGPLCIVAGAGTGKTRTITHRIAVQVAEGVARPDQILAVTFTDKAATELRGRLRGFGLPAPVRAATFHAAAWAQLRWFWPRLDAGPLPEVLASKVRLLVPLARRTRTEARDLAAEIEWAKARRLDPDGYAAAARDRNAPLPPDQMAAVYQRYERDKAAAGLVDYDDMLLRAVAMIAERPDIAAEVRGRYRFFTVDEFQDVNPAQVALLRAWLGDGREVCVVGDDDQTIYSFTGASSDHLTGFHRLFPGARTVTLSDNYRSTPEILTLANRVLWTKPDAARKRLRATLASGPAPRFRQCDDDAAEVDAVLADVRALIDGGVAPGGIAICYRVNSQSEPFEAALRGAGLPYVVRGAGGFYDRPEIRQALTVLRAAAGRPAPAPPLGLEDTVAARAPRPDADVRRVLREQMGYDERREPAGDAAQERWRNLGALVEAVTRVAAADPPPSFADVVADLERRAAEGADAPGDGGAVTLLTLHRAKGLEFDAVFLVACEEGLLPISHAKTDAEVEEERRLLYVGVTRARRHLTLSWALERPGWGGRTVRRRPSRLLYNLGPGAPRTGGDDRPRHTVAKGAPSQGPARECACGRPLVGSADRRRGACWACFSGGASPVLADALRHWRSARANADEVPAFVVFSDRTLAELARVQPTTPAELRRVTGMGPAKVARYGEDLLRGPGRGLADQSRPALA